MPNKNKKFMREIYKINRFNCIISGGMLDHREYKLNNCLKEYMQGKCGIFRALLIGLFGSNNIKSYGAYINYYIINHYDFIENDVDLLYNIGEVYYGYC